MPDTPTLSMTRGLQGMRWQCLSAAAAALSLASMTFVCRPRCHRACPLPNACSPACSSASFFVALHLPVSRFSSPPHDMGSLSLLLSSSPASPVALHDPRVATLRDSLAPLNGSNGGNVKIKVAPGGGDSGKGGNAIVIEDGSPRASPRAGAGANLSEFCSSLLLSHRLCLCLRCFYHSQGARCK